MEAWHKLIVDLKPDDDREIISSLLMFNGADSVVEQDDSLDVYLNSENLVLLQAFIKNNDYLSNLRYNVEQVENQNWNAVWESSFSAINIDDIHIRAEFHPKTNMREIVIQPKMAFGTGHHETTFMMIQLMNKMDLSGFQVLDYGCGTGILTVFAAMQGAFEIVGIDIQEEAVENTFEHFELNKIPTDNLTVLQGDLEVLDNSRYDLILANINRHVLLENSLALKDKLKTDGKLLLSGILQSDRNLILDTYQKAGFNLISENQKGNWCLFYYDVT